MASVGHRDQVRKGSMVPYIEHPLAVALILDRSGFDESVVIAGLLHDLVEDTAVTLDQIRQSFGERVAGIVEACSEEKVDALGRKRPWVVRKREHVKAMGQADDDVRSVVLADKLHNLVSIRLDLIEGRPVWESFNADRDRVIGYYRAMLDACRSDNSRVVDLLEECLQLLDAIEALTPGISTKSSPAS